MTKPVAPSKEMVLASAAKFTTPTEWKERYPTHRSAAMRNGWYDLATQHMPRKEPLTKEDILTSAAKCITLSEWREKYPKHRGAALRHGWYDLATKNLIKVYGSSSDRNTKIHTRESVLASAAQYTSASEWKQGDPNAYDSAEAAVLRAQFLVHRRYWDAESALANAKSFESLESWKSTYPGAFKVITNLGLVEKATAHMKT